MIWLGPRHHDDVSVRNVPVAWKDLEVTVDIEAKAKERALPSAGFSAV